VAGDLMRLQQVPQALDPQPMLPTIIQNSDSNQPSALPSHPQPTIIQNSDSNQPSALPSHPQPTIIQNSDSNQPSALPSHPQPTIIQNSDSNQPSALPSHPQPTIIQNSDSNQPSALPSHPQPMLPMVTREIRFESTFVDYPSKDPPDDDQRPRQAMLPRRYSMQHQATWCAALSHPTPVLGTKPLEGQDPSPTFST
jgi:hypothetical protein